MSAVRSVRTLSLRVMARERECLEVVDGDGAPRPRTRGDCIDGPRPCPWVGCRHNAFLEVNQRTGSLQFNFPGTEPEDVDPARSCTLDVADGGPVPLDEAGDVLNLTRERTRQIEAQAMGRLHLRAFTDGTVSSLLREHAIDPDPNRMPVPGDPVMRGPAVAVEFEDEEQDEPLPDASVSFFSDDDEAVCRSVWTMVSRLWGIKSKGSITATRRLRARLAKEGR